MPTSVKSVYVHADNIIEQLGEGGGSGIGKNGIPLLWGKKYLYLYHKLWAG